MKYPLSLALALASVGSVAEPPALEHVLVSVPLHKTTAQTALPVTVLSGEQLHRAASATLGDTFNNTPGLASASFGPGVGQPVIRGQQGPRVTVLQNGTSSADASSLSADHSVSVEPMLADSIEILRGPATLLYGGGAIGGVVNVLDNRIPTQLNDGLTGGIEYRHDSASDQDTVVARADGAAGQFGWHLDGLYRDFNDLEIPGDAVRDEHEEGHEEHDRGVVENTSGRASSLTAGGSYHFDTGFLGLAVNQLSNDYGIPAGAHEEHEEDHEDEHEEEHDEEHEEEGGIRLEVEQTRYDGALHWHHPLAGLEVGRAFLTYTDYQHKELEGNGEVGTTYSNESWEGRLELVHEAIADIHGVFGLQGRKGEFSALGEEAFIPLTDSSEVGGFVLEDFHRNDWTLEAGLRLDWAERNPDTTAAGRESFTALSVSGSALWDFHPSWQLGLALSRAERAPATEELYSNIEGSGPGDWVVHAATNAIELGNPDLDTEVSYNTDLSLRWNEGPHFVDMTAYYNAFDDYINLLNTGQVVDETSVLAYVQSDATFYGLEIDSEFALARVGAGALTGGLFADVIRGELDRGDDIPRLPPARIGMRLNWSTESLSLWTTVLEAADQSRPGTNEEETEGYTRWDAGVEYLWRVPHGELKWFLSLTNIADQEIRLSTSFLRDVAPEAGRSLEAGLRYQF